MKRLIVLAPGLNTSIDEWKELKDRLNQEKNLIGSIWLDFKYKNKLYSRGNPQHIAIELRALIDQKWKAIGPFDDVILVGHSVGGLLIREAYLLGCGVGGDFSQKSDWVQSVSRIILFAGVNRGVDTTKRWQLIIGGWLGRWFPPYRNLIVWHIFRGSDFITNLRIRWIRQFAALGKLGPVVIQLLGTRDDLVSRDDSVDIEQFPSAYYIEIPGAGHADLHHLTGVFESEERYALLCEGFVKKAPSFGENKTISGSEQVIFILHGIRANNKTWVEQITTYIQNRWPGVKVISPQYKFVSALQFANPMTRRRNLRWFQDAYSEALAQNPHARLSFIGHSNGTYLFGESLRSIPGMQFERAVLVGSVLPTDYEWNERVDKGQIKSLRIDNSCHDYPVGWLCSALQGMLMKDVGTGGYDGFIQPTDPSKKTEFCWYKGGHSAPLDLINLPSLAEYAVEGIITKPVLIHPEIPWFSIVSRALRVLAPIGFILATIGWLYLFWAMPGLALLVIFILVIGIFILDIV